MRRHYRITLSLVLLLCGVAACSSGNAPRVVSAPVPPSPGCGGRAAAVATAPHAVIPGVRYRCVSLPSGHALWLGESGPEGAAAGAEVATVLLVHGLGTNAHSDWALTVPELARHFHVLTVDLPGFGGSALLPDGNSFAIASLANLLAQVVESTTPSGRVHLVGHSLGAALALQFAYQHPERVDRLVLVDAAGILLKPVYVQALAQLQPPRVGLGAVDRLMGLVSDRVNGLASLALLGHDQRADPLPLLARYPAARQALLGGSTQMDLALRLVEHDFTAAIRHMQAPTTLVWGGRDRIAPLRTGELLAARLPHAHLEVISDSGHTPMQDSPAAFNQILLRALQEPQRSRTLTAAVADTPSKGHVICRNTDDLSYTGRFDSITLEHCGHVRIHHAQIGRLVVNASTVSLNTSQIDSDDVALTAEDSEVQATASVVRGRVAIRTTNSYFDLAGVTLLATQGPAVQMVAAPSRLFLSVSDWQGADYAGEAHFVWPRRP